MKVLQLHNFYRIVGGEDIVVRRERVLLEQHGHQVIGFDRSNSEMDVWPLWRWALLPLETVFSSRTYRDVRALCRRERPDLAHLHNVYFLLSPSVYYALAHEQVPIVQTCHNYRWVCPGGLFYSAGEVCERCKHGNYFHALIRCCYRDSWWQTAGLVANLSLHRSVGRLRDRVDAFIALSEFSRQKLLEGGLPADRLFLKPNFLSEEVLPEFSSEDYAIVMCRLQVEKDVKTAVEAFRHLPGFRLMVVGDGPLMGELKSLVKQLGLNNVEFKGFVGGDDRFQLLRRARLMVLTSCCFENFSVSVLEAYAMGKPVVASRIGAIAEIVEDGKTGFLFEPGNPVDLAAKLQRLLADPALVVAQGHAARQRFEQRYSAEINYRQLMEIYDFARRRHGVGSVQAGVSASP